MAPLDAILFDLDGVVTATRHGSMNRLSTFWQSERIMG
jgi:beta-phosphoglucomutase-like phosphatase (HAD superfamily)